MLATQIRSFALDIALAVNTTRHVELFAAIEAWARENGNVQLGILKNLCSIAFRRHSPRISPPFIIPIILLKKKNVTVRSSF